MRSIRLTATRKKSLTTAIDAVEAHIVPALDVWPSLTPDQRVALLEHSPVLTRIIDLSRRVTSAVDSWQR